MKMNGRRHSKRGFTLLEALAGGVILALGVATLFGLSARCLSQARINQHQAAAWEILDQQLTLIDVVGIDTFVGQATREGSISRSGTVYHWSVAATEDILDRLYVVEMVVSWQEHNRLRRISASTMMNGRQPLVTDTVASAAQ